MDMPQSHTTTVARYFPSERFGAIHAATPISVGLSGAAVYSVATATGEYVLRIMPAHEAVVWPRQLAMLRLVSEHGVAPPLAYVDEVNLATVSARIVGPPFGAALSDPGARDRAIGSLVDQVAKLHSLTLHGIERLDPPAVARALWKAQSARPAFPRWALPFDAALEDCAQIVASDARFVLSHNDLNPGNALWDGERIWLVDWTSSGLAHPYYDLATMSMFLQLPDDAALALLARQEKSAPTETQAETFRALRRVAAILCGLMFVKLTSDGALSAPERIEDAPTMSQVYGMMRAGTLDLQSDAGRCQFALALLRSAAH
jgi:aminoglycoside phosphotransferase (APT) family kinase protein